MIICDNTRLKSTATCELQAALRHVLGYTASDERIALRCGIAVHEALAVYLQELGRSSHMDARTLAVQRLANEYIAFSSHHIEPYIADRKHWERFTFANVAAVLGRWLETHPAHALPFVVDAALVEVGFQVPLASDDAGWIGDVTFVGRLDAVVATRDRRQLYVLDHKTTGQVNQAWARQYRTDSQMSGYVWAAEQALGQPIAGIYINAIELSKLPGSDRKCSKHGLTYAECGPEHATFEILEYARSDEALERWKRDALRLAGRFGELSERVKTPSDLDKVSACGTFTGACRFCEFSDWCSDGRRSVEIETRYVHEVWDPLSRVEGAKL